MAFIREIKLRGLFGLYDHSLTLRSDPRVTVVAGPNGIGKSTLLSLTRALALGDMREMGKYEFAKLSVEMNDGNKLTVEPFESENSEDESTRKLRISHHQDGDLIRKDDFDALGSRSDLILPTYIEQHGPNLFFDRREAEYLQLHEVEARYGRPRRAGRREEKEQASWVEELTAGWGVEFIETKRLDAFVTGAMRQRSAARKREQEAPIDVYLAEVTRSLFLAQRESDRTRQVRDRSFARRMLDKGSKVSVKEQSLRARYADLTAEAERLAAHGLLTDSLDAVLPKNRLSPTEKRVLNLFVDDFEEKLEPLRPLALRVEMLQAIIESKFINKRMAIDSRNGVGFFSEPGDRHIAADALSSGEQHELALISQLLFGMKAGTTVLIDEPELSLHIGWQHEMIDDLIEIARVADLSFVLATHSTAIINGRWDLLEELGPLDEQASSRD